jgi:hypothetical protein
VSLEIQNYSRQHINISITSPADGLKWKFMGFYEHSEAHKWQEAWGLLHHLKSMTLIPWVCIGDFNEILDLLEKYGGHGHQRSRMEAFQNTLEYYKLFELDCKGPRFTWTNGNEGLDFIKQKLDQVVANREWYSCYPRVEVLKEIQLNSDHCFVSIFPRGMTYGRRQKGGF